VGEIFDSHGISIDAWDRVWVADRDAHQIVAFDLSGQPIVRLGERHHPKWEAPFNHPTRAAVAEGGAIFVADRYGNARIHEFSPEGEWRSSFGEIGAGQRQFMTPIRLSWIESRDC
jgi:NHL repeat